MDETLDSETAEHRATWPARALYRGATAVFVRGEWLDALVYRLLALRHATRLHEGGQPDTVHFFVGSLGFGGAQRQLVVFVRYLVGRGYRCKVWVQERQGFFETEITDAGATWECVFGSPDLPPRGGLFFRFWRRLRARSHVWTALALAARLRREPPAVLQCLLDTTNVAGALAGRMAGVPVVVAGLRSLHPGERNPAMASRFQQHCYRLLRPSLVDAVIANSNSGRVSFLRQQPEMPASKVRVVWSGLDPTPPSSATAVEIRSRLGLPPEVPIVLWAGRLAPEKRLDVFLHACTTLSESGRQFVALVVGDGAERRRMEALAAQLGLIERVRFLGLRSDVLDIIQVARVAVLTSEIEGLANILLEAHLAACPTVATRAGGTPEVVEDKVTGFLVDIGDHAAVASHVARLLDDPALAAAMGRAGAERSRRLFGAARMGEETLEIYRGLAEKRGFRTYAAGNPGGTALNAHPKKEEPQGSLPMRALCRVVAVVFDRCGWLDALAYRLLALRYATRSHEVAGGETIHFFVGSLGLGGAQRQLVTLVRHLVGRGYRCKVWVQERRTFFESELEAAGATWECVVDDSPDSPWWGQLFFHFWRLSRYRFHVCTALALAARLRRERPAVLQCLLDIPNVAGALAGRMAGVPVVVAGLLSLHPGERRASTATRFQKRCYRLLCPSLVDAVIANSERGRASFLLRQPEMPASKVRVVRNGLDPGRPSSETDAEIRRGLDLPPGPPLVLWAGRLAPEKRLDVFLRACADLAALGCPFLALILGDGKERSAMEVLAVDLGLSDRVHFVGLRKDVTDVIRIARVTVLTSEIEGLPNILLEAQLAGCPVVATRAGGTSELVEDEVTGFLVEIGDHADVASKVAKLIHDPALAAEVGRAGAERSRRLFGATRMGEETLAIYRELAERLGCPLGPAGSRGDQVWRGRQ